MKFPYINFPLSSSSSLFFSLSLWDTRESLAEAGEKVRWKVEGPPKKGKRQHEPRANVGEREREMTKEGARQSFHCVCTFLSHRCRRPFFLPHTLSHFLFSLFYTLSCWAAFFSRFWVGEDCANYDDSFFLATTASSLLCCCLSGNNNNVGQNLFTQFFPSLFASTIVALSSIVSPPLFTHNSWSEFIYMQT